LILPDINVWVALAHEAHPHNRPAAKWLDDVPIDKQIFLCRITQMGLLRLLTNSAALGPETLTQKAAWEVYELFLLDPRVHFHAEPIDMERIFRSISAREEKSPKRWTDDYLLAFAEAANLTFVTFDRTLAARTSNAILLAA
jgi:uncharacterized protein